MSDGVGRILDNLRRLPVKRGLTVGLAALGTGLGACSGPSVDPPVSAGFVAHELWDDGLAEFNVYRGHEIRYGAPQQAEVIHILVSEHFAPREYVKADDAGVRGSYPVLKLNQVLGIQTGVYRYQQMTSHFWRREDGRLLRFNLTSGDSCGNTWKDARRNRHRRQRMDYQATTYWESMSEVRQVLEVPDDGVFYDELPVWVRALATDLTPGAGLAFQLAPGVVDSQSRPIDFGPATARIEEAPAEEGRAAPRWRVSVDHAGGRDEFLLEAVWPFRLERWDKADGGWLERVHSQRLAYWEFNQPGDLERLLAGELQRGEREGGGSER